MADGAILKYMPVSLHGPAGRVDTFAFLDDGSTSTLMDHGLLAELGVSGTPHSLCLQWTGNIQREEKHSIRLSVRISAYNEPHKIHELSEVYTVNNLVLPTQSVDMTHLAAKYTHFRGLPLGSYVNAMPRVLIGVNDCCLSKSLKCVEGKCVEPVASKTRLGWVVYGPGSSVIPALGHGLFHISACDGTPDDQLSTVVKEFFNLESI